MSVNKKDYKIVEEDYGYSTIFVVKKRFLWIFWKSIKNASGNTMYYETRRGAQAYINFLK